MFYLRYFEFLLLIQVLLFILLNVLAMILFPIMNLYLLTLRQSRQRDGIPRFYALEYFLHYIEIVFVAEKAIFRLFGLIGENCFGILTNLLLFPF